MQWTRWMLGAAWLPTAILAAQGVTAPEPETWIGPAYRYVRNPSDLTLTRTVIDSVEQRHTLWPGGMWSSVILRQDVTVGWMCGAWWAPKAEDSLRTTQVGDKALVVLRYASNEMRDPRYAPGPVTFEGYRRADAPSAAALSEGERNLLGVWRSAQEQMHTDGSGRSLPLSFRRTLHPDGMWTQTWSLEGDTISDRPSGCGRWRLKDERLDFTGSSDERVKVVSDGATRSLLTGADVAWRRDP